MHILPRRAVGFAIIVALLAVAAGCSLKRSPEDVARQFMTAWHNSDEAGMRALMTKAAREKLDRPLELHQSAATVYSVGTASVQDDFAQVPVTLRDGDKDQRLTVKMRQDEGEWRVHAMSFPLIPGGPDVTFDMEHPENFYANAFKGLGEGLGAMFKGMGEGMGAMFKGMGEGLEKLNQATNRQ